MAKKTKKQLTRAEEFEILKLVLDKFLWIGVIIMGYGFFRLITTDAFWQNFVIMAAGIVLLLLFMWLLIREYKFMKW